MPTYRVFWEIDIHAETPIDAARQALKIHRDPEGIATVFEVHGPECITTIDLSEDEA